MDLSMSIIKANLLMARQGIELYKNKEIKEVKNQVAYHLQQAAEKLIKIQVYSSGCEYNNRSMYVHNIRKYLGTFIEINGFKRKPNTRILNGLCQTVILNTFLITFNLIDDLHANKLRCLRGF